MLLFVYFLLKASTSESVDTESCGVSNEVSKCLFSKCANKINCDDLLEGFYGFGSDDSVEQPSGVTLPPTPQPKKEKTPNPSPTAFPTLKPTPKTTDPPKPVFTKSEFTSDILTALMEAAVAAPATPAPTKRPTGMPTEDGFAVVVEERTVSVLQTALTFSLTETEAKDPVMQQAVEEGVAASMGLDPHKVSITHINGVAVESRHLSDTGVEYTFQIESASGEAAAVEVLQKRLEEAATEGSIVANVQKKAAEKGKLSDSLKEMPRVLDKPVVLQKEKTVEVLVQRRSNTPAPTMPPSKMPELSGTTTASPSILAFFLCCLVVAFAA
jgi:hypothetical protein